MEIIIELACKYKFERLNSKLGRPIVFHCVPGAGKSSLIRELLCKDSRFRAYTLGIADPPNLRGCLIHKWEGSLDSSKLNILDEYNLEATETSQFIAVFGDPIQSQQSYTLRADFICKFSQRFGRCTAELLKDLGFEVEASGDDVVQIVDLYSVDPKDTILYYEENVGCLLRRHNLPALHISEAIGQTFGSVTFVTAESKIPADNRATVFQCLSRHRTSLMIMSPDGTYTSA
ncbi:triple gene block protein 1 [Pseudostellaria heterophylla carlavirus 1]|uniref:Triple gene block protein 1 n=1 Tax=Pseudostellaria heterophylla carlavirus 1 TaxID=2982810 RepID=A0A977TNA8_9VIRU|nr:triple gene block protein 1 [Pseudostellaria heterophylla carlavirus 1]